MQQLIRTWVSTRTPLIWTTLKWTPKAPRKHQGTWKRNREPSYRGRMSAAHGIHLLPRLFKSRGQHSYQNVYFSDSIRLRGSP